MLAVTVRPATAATKQDARPARPFPPVKGLKFLERLRTTASGVNWILLVERVGREPLLARERRNPVDRGRIDEQSAREAPFDPQHEGGEADDEDHREIDLHLAHGMGHPGRRRGPRAHRKR